MVAEQGNRGFWTIDLPAVAGLLLFGSLLLLRFAYLPIYLSSLYCLIFLAAAWLYLWKRLGIRVPPLLVFLVYLTALLDGLGNYFQLYTSRFAYIQYDEFTHSASPALAAPVLVWLFNEGLKRFGYRLPLGLVTLFAVTAMFTIAGFYEIVELWDDKYMHPQPGMRIHGPYDTPNDLQWNLLGMVIGGLIAYWIMKRREQRAVDA